MSGQESKSSLAFPSFKLLLVPLSLLVPKVTCLVKVKAITLWLVTTSNIKSKNKKKWILSNLNKFHMQQFMKIHNLSCSCVTKLQSWFCFDATYIGCKYDNMSHTRLLFYYFLKNISKIFLKYSWKSIWIFSLKKFHTILLRFMFKTWQKCHFQKNSNPFISPFTSLKASVKVFNEWFGLFFTHWINFKLNHMFP